MTEMSKFAHDIMQDKYSHLMKGGIKEEWENIAYRVAKHPMKSVDAPKDLVAAIQKAIEARKFIPGGRYLANCGRPYHMVQNCLLYRAEDSREGWSELLHNSAMSLMSGGGLGGNYSRLRGEGKPIRRTGGTATGPIALMQMINESGRGIVNGGNRRCALWAGLSWNHPDVFKFITCKNWPAEIKALKERDFSFPARLDMTNISVCLDEDFFEAYANEKNALHAHARAVYWAVIRQMCETAEPGFSVDIGKNKGEDLRNACTEITSADDSDVCNLGSINLARVESLQEMHHLVEIATAYLIAGTVYSDVPHSKVDLVRSKNRRLGLGLMGIHEFLLKRQQRYGPSADLEKYLEAYANSDYWAKLYAKKWDLSVPVKTRAIAPVGTIGIVAETTTGIEPIFCAAFKQRYWKGDVWHAQYVLDPTAKRFVDAGLDPDKIEDAYSLAENVERRVAFQAWVQQYVDHAISSTINMPAWGSRLNNENTVRSFGEMLIRYLPQLRGITVYPDGARGGQPMTAVKYATAAKHVGEVTVESQDICSITGKGTCGA